MKNNQADSTSYKEELIGLLNIWAANYGWLNGKIDLSKTPDWSSFTLPVEEAFLTAHSPLYGVKPGKEEPSSVAEVRKKLAPLLNYVKLKRQDLHLAVQGTKEA
jgi:hypothetical protein